MKAGRIYRVANAQLEKDQANFTHTKLAFDRAGILVKTRAVSQDAYDVAKNAYEQAEAQIDFDQATILQRQALLDAVQINLDYTNIVSPLDGTVVSRNVTMGQTVSASFQTPTLFLIASDLTRERGHPLTDNIGMKLFAFGNDGCERRRSDCAAEAAQHIEEACCGHRTFRVRFAIAMLDNGAIRKARPRRFAERVGRFITPGGRSRR